MSKGICVTSPLTPGVMRNLKHGGTVVEDKVSVVNGGKHAGLASSLPLGRKDGVGPPWRETSCSVLGKRGRFMSCFFLSLLCQPSRIRSACSLLLVFWLFATRLYKDVGYEYIYIYIFFSVLGVGGGGFKSNAAHHYSSFSDIFNTYFFYIAIHA